MFRSLIALALSLFLVAEAGAQTVPTTTPTKTTRSAKATARAARRAAKKAQRVALKKTAAKPVATNDGWPPLDDTQTAVATTATTATTDAAAAYGASSTASRGGEIDNANIYAAPGMPTHLRTSNGMTPYSVRPARKPAATPTTLGN